ncbi:MAG TPA: PQQ-binding-like beta-propeller repeat protein, partial [Candidatus Acidoferrum sp.]|nr:PQQ-binding-like beta-propeller repeat protein [Candidatus Acidoferrum sp.]
MSFARLVTTLALLTTAAATFAQNTNWSSYNNDFTGQRYSALKQINAGNATQLGEVCRVQIDGPTSFHAGIVVNDGTIYSATARETVALDAQSCAVKWKYTWQSDDVRCGGGNRGVALLNGRLFRGTCDGHLIALDAQSGKLLWQNLIAVTGLGESTPGVPLAWQNVVYMGVAGSDLGIRGRVLAFDALTGHELWRFNTIPMGNDVGANTWKKPETAKTGGGGVWGVMSLDVSTRELLVPVGNPWPDLVTGYRPGDNLFTNSIVVLDALTGQLKWWHQVAPADFKDMDLVAAPMIFRTDGAHDYMIIGGKDGYVTGVDRDTHKQVFRTAVTTVEDLVKAP